MGAQTISGKDTEKINSHSCREFKKEFAHLRKAYSGISVEITKKIDEDEWEFIYDTLRNGGVIIAIKFCPFCGEKLK